MQISRPNNKFENSLLEFLDKNLDKNLVKNFEDFLTVKKNSRSYSMNSRVSRGNGNLRENPRSWQEFQDILHWVLYKTCHPMHAAIPDLSSISLHHCIQSAEPQFVHRTFRAQDVSCKI